MCPNIWSPKAFKVKIDSLSQSFISEQYFVIVWGILYK